VSFREKSETFRVFQKNPGISEKKRLFPKYFNITGHRTDNIKDVIATVIATYNSSSHRTLKNKSSNQVFKDNDDQIARHLNDSSQSTGL
jgi:hypothetical protein